VPRLVSRLIDGSVRAGELEQPFGGVEVWCASDDFVNDLVALIPPGLPPIKEHLISGDVLVGDYTAVGSNSLIMPGNHIPEGTVLGVRFLALVGVCRGPGPVHPAAQPGGGPGAGAEAGGCLGTGG